MATAMVVAETSRPTSPEYERNLRSRYLLTWKYLCNDCPEEHCADEPMLRLRVHMIEAGELPLNLIKIEVSEFPGSKEVLPYGTDKGLS
ncbi:uncharacterized protein BJX67DRAFT_345216 [Aspergillus lucknowensis]|uniref:Uncharacterized protein n=1 Tax=Aspergillus lucknowensis TaxID=176173 RepID=A0ABR4M0M8_9EURO